MTDHAGRYASQLVHAAEVALRQPGDARTLTTVLYDRWYAPATGTAPHGLGPMEVATHLRAADTASARFEDGWTVTTPREATERTGPPTSPWQVPAVRGGDVRWVDPIDLVVPGGIGLRPPLGTQVAVCARRDSVSMLPGWWTTTSQAWSRSSPPLLRLYWSVDPGDLCRVVERLTAHLDPATPYALKCPLDLDRCRRPDAVVLFAPAAEWSALRDRVAAAHRAVVDWLRPRIPALTRALARGLALAEDPGDDSFGMHRCGILARALHDDRRAGVRDAVTLQATAASALEAHGIRPDAPWRNPGSTAPYPWDPQDAGAPAAPVAPHVAEGRG